MINDLSLFIVLKKLNLTIGNSRKDNMKNLIIKSVYNILIPAFLFAGICTYGQDRLGSGKSLFDIENDKYYSFIPGKIHNSQSGMLLFANDENDKKAPDTLQLRKYFSNYLLVPYHAIREVIRLDQPGLDRNIFVVCVLGSTFVFDQAIRNLVQDKLYVGNTDLSRFLFNVGKKEYFVPGFAGLYGVSLLSGNRYFHDTMLLSFQSLIVTQAFTELTKHTVTRLRPRHSPDDPFAREKGSQSFISGHASGTWAVMTIIAGRYPKLQYGAYGFATAVSLARVYDDAHWMSDVFMGALVGYGVARLTLKFNDSTAGNFAVAPYYNSKAAGASILYSF